jgi:hypothetical protein
LSLGAIETCVLCEGAGDILHTRRHLLTSCPSGELRLRSIVQLADGHLNGFVFLWYPLPIFISFYEIHTCKMYIWQYRVIGVLCHFQKKFSYILVVETYCVCSVSYYITPTAVGWCIVILLLHHPDCCLVMYCCSAFLFHYYYYSYYITPTVVGWCIAILRFFFTIIITSPRVMYCYSTFLFHYYYYYSFTYFCPLDFSEMPWSNFMKPCRNIICHVKMCCEGLIFSSPDPKGHVSYCHHLASVVRLYILLWNHWANLNQTWPESSLGGSL